MLEQEKILWDFAYLCWNLTGMGQSGKSPTRAHFFLDHARYLDAWFDALHLDSNIVLVLHDSK